MIKCQSEHPLLVVAGPTATGKSSLALAIAEKFGGTIINSDSMQVYGELRIITARPSAQEEARAPHKLYGMLSVSERCSVGRWMEMAVAEIQTAWNENYLPIIVGGTGLYINAILNGLSRMPAVPAEVRQTVRTLHEEIGATAFRARLAEIDPEAAARLPENDTQRLTRAYEVYLSTGKSLSNWHREEPVAVPPTACIQTFLLEPPREVIYARCNARFDQMIASGALGEVEKLMSQGLDPSLPAMKAVGVPELSAHLSGELTLEEASERAKKATRNFAKRQLTWFRNKIGKPDAIFAQYSERMDQKIFSKILF